MLAIDIQVELDGGEIVITRPPSSFLLAYRKSSKGPSLVLARSRLPPTSVTTAERISNQYFPCGYQQGTRAQMD